MKPYQREFLEFCVRSGVLLFGEFTLKSGRQSPYFFNAGHFNTGEAFVKISEAYSQTIIQHFNPSDYDVLFGPAYKGISLATATSMGLMQQGHNIPVCFNRKEKKDHGEGGSLIGAALKGKKILLIDDVMTAGTTVRETAQISAQEGGTLSGIVIALDRQEKGLQSDHSAVYEIGKAFHLPIYSVISFADVLSFARSQSELAKYVRALSDYQAQWGAKTA